MVVGIEFVCEVQIGGERRGGLVIDIVSTLKFMQCVLCIKIYVF